jgi:hypothetical protein
VVGSAYRVQKTLLQYLVGGHFDASRPKEIIPDIFTAREHQFSMQHKRGATHGGMSKNIVWTLST